MLFQLVRIHLNVGRTNLYNQEELAIDWRRVFAFGSSSLVLAPTVHYWYIYLDGIVAGSQVSIIFKKLGYDAVIFSPIYIFLFYCFQSAFEGTCYADCFQKLRATGPVLWTLESVSWIPLQFINFRFVPLTYRVLYDNVVSFSFDTLYSLVYHADEIPPTN
ncbi:unnamed protein product [Mesocestoides corti]|uniref:Mitochondrial inner membrane protein Mpv17 n=1 Tax=Mesocestoides corti TaxID=53468 RepID=A0A0R3U9I6_MESCO|nr:unnamed protein product [Mesocestoides corti]